MGFLDIFRKKTEDWYYGLIPFENTPKDIEVRDIKLNEEYLSVFMKSMRIVNVRKGLSKFYAVIHSFTSVPHRGGSPAEFNVVTSPAKLGELDAKNIDRVIDINKRLLGPVPYRGGDFKMEMGLFSIKSADLAKPFMNLLEQMSGLAGVSFISAALPYAKPLEDGINLLTGGNDDTVLEIGLSKVFKPVKTGYYAVIRAPKDSIDISSLTVDKNDFKLVTKEGQPLKEYPYIVFNIDGSPQREAWFEIPDLAAAHKTIFDQIRNKEDIEARLSIDIFKRLALTSNDLIMKDAKAIIAELKEDTDAALAATTVSDTGDRRIKRLEEYNIYQ